jgi:nitrous oxidase accessory protein NosD
VTAARGVLHRTRVALAGLTLAAANIAVMGAQPAAADGGCPSATVSVSTPTALQLALAEAQPGDVIGVADGTYDGNWTATTPGTAEAPIWLCGGPGAELTNDGYTGNYGLHLDGASWWHLYGFTVTQASKGVVVDNAQHVTVEALTVYDIGDEGVHLRTNTTDSLVTGNTIYSTGHRRDKFGEGVYVGSANGNWSVYTGGQPDRSDRNVVTGNNIYGTTAEPVDVKEGTTNVQVLGNTLDGAALTTAGGDSCADIKGNYGLVSGNVCTGVPAGDGYDGYQVHHNKLIKLGLGDWGLHNELAGNTALIGPGARDGFWIHDASTTYNIVRCGQTVTGAAYANVVCTP